MLKLMEQIAGAVVGVFAAVVIVSFLGIENEFMKGVAMIVGALWGVVVLSRKPPRQR